MDLVLAWGRLVNICHELGKAADAIATHLWLRPVAVEDAHRQVGLADCWQRKDDLCVQRRQAPRPSVPLSLQGMTPVSKLREL